jgi:hypothetical protein
MMDTFIIFIVAGIALSLFSIVLMIIYSILENDHRKKELRKYARQQIIKQMEREKQMEARKLESRQETVDLAKEYR